MDSPALHVRLLRPAPGEAVVAGRRINGIGWLACAAPVAAIDIGLGGVGLGPAQFGLSAAAIATLTGQAPPAIPADAAGWASGFVFAATIPDLPAGPTVLRVAVSTAGGRLHHDFPLRLAAAVSPHPPPPEPVRAPIQAMVDLAEIDERGILCVSGWAVSLLPLEQLVVHVGERAIGEVQRDLRRDDVAAEHGAAYANALTSGFLLKHEIGDADLEQTALHLVARSAGGQLRIVTASIKRPAQIRRRPPERQAELCCEEVFLSTAGVLAVKGWAVCSSGVASIRVELDDAPVGAAAATEFRPDVGNNFPRIPSARQAGFRLVQALAGRWEGEHVVRIAVSGHDGEETAVLQAVQARLVIPEHFLAQVGVAQAGIGQPTPAAPPAADDAAIRCFLDVPAVRDGAAIDSVRGFMSLSGWAFARTRIERVEVFVDGVSQGRAHHGIRRDDLKSAFPDYDSLLSGFAMVIPPQAMKPGEHAIRIEIADADGHVRETGFSIRAEKAAAGPGPWTLRRKLPQSEIDLQRAVIAARGPAPQWRLILAHAPGAADPGQPTPAALAATIESLRHQAYDHWSLVLLADAPALAAALAAAYPELADRLRVVAPVAGRSLAEHAAGADFVAVLAAGDRLGEDALLEMSVEAALTPQADFLYSDERRIDPADGEDKAFFKPDWSPELLLSTNYVGRLWAATPALLRRAGLGEDLARGEYDAVLRLTEQASHILHVAKVLCATGRRGEAAGVEQRALRAAMRRRGIAGAVVAGAIPGSHRIRRPVRVEGMVSIVIPTVAAKGLIETAITSIRAHTAWPSYEIVCLDNIPRAGTPEQRHWKAWIAAHADRTIEIASAFNWSRFNNRGARAARGDYLLFLNDDIEVRDPDWLHGLVEQAQRPEIGVVGPQLLYPDGRVQHAGVFLARHAARHAFRFYPRDEPGPFGLARTQRDVTSVTGACMLMRRAVFDELGGFDEAHAIVNNDLDFNLRVRRGGRAVVFTPWVSLVHHEMVSRSKLLDTYHSQKFDHAWGDLFLKGDPFFSPHFSTDYDDYLPEAEPVRQFNVGHPLVARDRIRKILAVKVDHIGDFITAFPAFRRLKALFPRAELTVLAARASLALAALEPAIDRVVEFNFYFARSEKGRRSAALKELAELRRRLAPERFDLAVDLRRQPDTRPILQATGARWLAGFERGYEHPWLDFAVEFEGDLATHWKRDHVTDSLVHLVDAISANCETDRRVVRDPPTREAARQGVMPLLLRGGLGADRLARPLVCVHTGAGAINKQWPGASFAGLIDLLAGEAGAAVAVIGGPDEAEFAAAVVKLVRRQEGVVNLVGKTGLRDLPAVLRAADLYVGNDSGPKHIAAALGVPTIGIHSGSVDSGEWGPLGPSSITIRRDMTCSPCYLAHAADCHRNLACLVGIKVGDVFRACRRLLALSAVAAEARLECAAE